MPNPELVVFVGLQASGKTTFYRTHFARTHLLISKDLLRNNRRRARRQTQLVDDALKAGLSVVVDNTNPTRDDRSALITIGRHYGARVISYYFASALQDCLARNRGRTGTARVLDVALYATIKRLVPPSYAEGFDALYFVCLADEGTFDISAWQNGMAEER